MRITSGCGPPTNNLGLLGNSTMETLELDVQSNFLKDPTLRLAPLECCRPNWRVFFFSFWLNHAACGILVPQPGMESVPLHWQLRVLATRSPGEFHNWRVLKSANLTHVKMNPSNQTEARALKKQQAQSLPLESVWCGPECPW